MGSKIRSRVATEAAQGLFKVPRAAVRAQQVGALEECGGVVTKIGLGEKRMLHPTVLQGGEGRRTYNLEPTQARGTLAKHA